MRAFVILASLFISPCFCRGARIIGGKDAYIENHPYQLSLEFRGLHVCGAVIIDEKWVLTAAHCVIDKPVKDLRFRAGSSFIGREGTLHPAKQVYVHPEYDWTILRNDIAVVEVGLFFTYGPGVQAIPVTKMEPKAGEVGQITGWGTISIMGDKFPTQLQEASVNIIDRQLCDFSYLRFGGIGKDKICAGVERGDVDSCGDDSGGPLVVQGQLVGIVSGGHGCANPAFPGVYANVASLRNFIVCFVPDI